jgi:putative ABC transport system permease protein
LLGWAIPNVIRREGLLGDLQEEYEIRREDARGRAARWYWSSSLRLSARFGWDRLRGKTTSGNSRKPNPAPRHGDPIMYQVLQDLRFALRTLVKSPGFTAVAILTLAIGIGANTAMFSTLNAMLLQPLPFEEPERLVIAQTTFSGRQNWTSSAPDFVDYRDQNDVLESFSAMSGFSFTATVTGREEPERIETQWVSWDFFLTLGADPVIGRHFSPSEESLDAENVTIVSNSYWRTSLGADPAAIGSSLLFDGVPHTIIGVLPAGFRFLFPVDAYRPFQPGGNYASGRQYHNWTPIGRLKADVTLEQAQNQFNVIAANLEAAYPDTNEDKGMLLLGLQEALVQDYRGSLWMLMAAVGLVLLVACGNVANLLLARGTKRQSELAVRSALGAARSRLLRQLLTESLVIAVLAGVVGIILALWMQSLLLQALPLDQLGISELGLSVPTLLFALAASVVTSLIFGTIPALRAAPRNLSDHLKAGARSGDLRSGMRLRSGLVILQVAVSVVLLIGSGLLIRSFANLITQDPGFDTGNLLTAEIRLPSDEYPVEQRPLFFRQLEANLRGLPGVTDVALISQLPIRDPGNNIYVRDPRQPMVSVADMQTAYVRTIMPGYFEAMGIPLVAGRGIEATDTAEAPMVMVINETMAESLFPGENPIGLDVVIHSDDPVSFQVVGLVGDVRMGSLASDPRSGMYLSYYANRQTTMRIALRTDADPAALAPAVRSTVRQLDPNLPVADLETMESIIAGSSTVSTSRMVTASLGLFAGVALLLATVGLYGVLAHYVSQRSHEIGVRVALGAQGANVLKMILTRGLVLVGFGLILGIAAAIGGVRFLEQQLYGIEQTDPITFLTVSAFFVVVATIACLLPAWRATRVDPIIALQAE